MVLKLLGKISSNEKKPNKKQYSFIDEMKLNIYLKNLLYIIYKLLFTVLNADQKGDHSDSLRLVKESGHLCCIFIYMCFEFLFIICFLIFL